MKRAGDELGFSKEKLVQLRQLKPGEFFAFGPAISDEIIKLKVGEVKTSHAKVGYRGALKTPPPSSVIKKVLGELKDLPQEAEKELKNIQELKKEITRLRNQRPSIPVAMGVSQWMDYGKKNGYSTFFVDKAVKEAGVKYEIELTRIKKEIGEIDRYVSKAKYLLPNALPKLITVKEIRAAVKTLQRAEPIHPLYIKESQKIPKDSVIIPGEIIGLNGEVGKGEMAVLTALGQYPDGLDREHITVITGYKRSSRDAYIYRLKVKGLIDIV